MSLFGQKVGKDNLFWYEVSSETANKKEIMTNHLITLQKREFRGIIVSYGEGVFGN
jgi:hypothetical protein